MTIDVDAMARAYRPDDWHWLVAETGRYWSSAARAYTDTAPAYFTRAETEADVREVLTAAGCPDRAPSYVPQSVAMWQARAVLSTHGHLATVDAALQQAGGAALAAWEYAPTISRNSPLVQQMSALLQLSSGQVDTLFREAAQLKV